MLRPISRLDQAKIVRLIAALLLLAVGLLLSHAVWIPSAHATTECAFCFFLKDIADCPVDVAVVTLVLATCVIASRIGPAISASVLTCRTRAPPVVLIFLH